MQTPIQTDCETTSQETVEESALQKPVLWTGLSQSRLRELLHYDPITGDFTWKIQLSSKTTIGKVAGSLKDSGYIYIRINQQDYLAHKLAWFYVYGEWVRIDHEDSIGSHNFLKNLRPATSQQNNRNQSVRYDNALGVKGVYQAPSGKFCSRITVDGQFIHLGTYWTLEEATNARQIAAKQYFGEFYNEG
jgi:hypothetical protein